MNNKTLTRETVMKKLVKDLKQLSYVHALYEGGAAAFNRIDEWSDLDLYVIVDDEKVSETFLVVDEALRSLSPIARKLETPKLPWPGVSQAFYKLTDASEYLLIDLAVLKLSCPEKFLAPEIHGNPVFYFNKSGKIKIPRFNKVAFAKKLADRIDELKTRFDVFNALVQKEINRKNNLEAVDLYRGFTLASLVEALRIMHNPVHHDFRMRYVHYELPSKVISELERLYFVKDAEDLQRKYEEATRWFQETIMEIDSYDLLSMTRV